MSAIKKFLEAEREAIRIRDQRFLELQREMEEESVETEECDNRLQEEIANFDFLLHRTWFLDDSDILDLLYDASEDAFDHILCNIDNYPARVRIVIQDNYIPHKLSNKTVRELSDHDMLKIYMKHDEDMKNEIDEAWKVYLNENKIQRPEGDLDIVLKEKQDYLENQQKLLEMERTKKPEFYMSPSMRQKYVSSATVVLQSVIDTLKNEISEVKKHIDQEEKVWYASCKSGFALKYVSVPIVS